MFKKLFIEPYFGEFPTWFDLYQENFERLKKYGYEMLIVTDLKSFKERVGDKLGLYCNLIPGTRKVSDYRLALGHLFEEEIQGYDFWGHTDFDCVYGRVDKFVTEELLSGVDIHSNHHCYICGPWSLYRNSLKVNNLFRECSQWRDFMSEEGTNGWGEKEYSVMIDQHHEAGTLVRKYTHWQAHNPDIDDNLRWDGESLYDGDDEIMMHHFNRTKRWPPCLIKS